MKGIKINALILLSLFFFSGCIFFKGKFAKSVEAENGILNIKGISGTVYIRRDSLGVPYIEAQNEDDLFFGTGYVMATDRLFQMTAMKLVMQGRISEFIGKDMLLMDHYMRTIIPRERLLKTFANIDMKSRRILESFVAGINAYLSLHENLPAEFVLSGYQPEIWKIEDIMYIFMYLNLYLSTNMTEELNYLILAAATGFEKAAYTVPIYPDEDLPYRETAKLAGFDLSKITTSFTAWPTLREQLKAYTNINIPASNNMALAPARTKLKRSIIENDTHLGLTIPNAWMIIHQKCPGIDAAGVAVPGTPFLSAGFNGKIAWGVTMVMADSQDIFIEKMKTENGVRYYEYKGKWLPVEKRVEEFTDNKGRKSSIIVESTVHGPLLNDCLARMPFPPASDLQPLPIKSSYGLALAWAVEGNDTLIQGFYDLSRAGTMADVKTAISKIRTIYLNFIYGDKDNIGFQVSGDFPIRKKGTGQLPSPGWTGEYDWQGTLPFASLPSKLNPPEGYLATANNRTVPAAYPHVLTSSWYYPDRADRITERLSQMKDATGEAIIALQFERYSLMARKAQKLLHEGERSMKVREAIDRLPGGKKGKALEALAMLAPHSFDCVMASGSAKAAVMGSFYHTFSRNIFMDEFPEDTITWTAFQDMNLLSYSAQEDHLVVRDMSPFFDNVQTKEKETKWDIIALSLSDTIDFCISHMGKSRDKWQWGKLITYHWKHEISKTTSLFNSYFNRGPYPAGGDSHSINVASFPWGRNFNINMIPAMRLVVDFGKEEPACLTLTHGQSGNPSSRHYDDMIENFLSGKNHPLPFGKDAVKTQYDAVFELNPVK